MHLPDINAVEAYIRRSATARGIDPNIAVQVARSEGLAHGVWQSNARNKTGRREPSYGPFQLLVGGQGTGYPVGLGNEFIAKTGMHPSDPNSVTHQIDFALDQAKAKGWSPWYGAAKVGIGTRTGLDGTPSGTQPNGLPVMNAQFNPEQAGAVLVEDTPFDPVAAGAELIEDVATPQITPIEGPPTPEPMNPFAAQIAGMDETDLAIARSKNDPLGEYLRGQAQGELPGETEEQRFERQYGSLPDTNASALDAVRTFTRGVVEGVPIAGPSLLRGVETVAAGIDSATSDRTYEESRSKAGEIRRMDKARNPTADIAGQVTGAVAPMMALGATALGGRALGVTGPTLSGRIGASGVTTGVVSGADTAARGGSSEDVTQSAGIGTAVGGAVPFLGAGVNALGRGVRNAVGLRVSAPHRVKAAVDADTAAGQVISAADETAASQSGQRLLNVDRGGEATRALARSAANVDPNARAIIERTASDRFAGQYGRAADFITRIVGGQVDDVALQESVRNAARASNKPAYARAYGADAAQAMWDNGFENLIQAPAMQQAVRQAVKRGANRAVTEGFEPIRNPFRVVDGRLVVKELTKPTLQFWDQVKRNLDGMIGKAQRTGDKTYAADLTALKRELVNKLDEAVPEYAIARAGAARFFEAEDAIEAGKKFVSQNKDIRQSARAIKSMTPQERKAFAVGFSAELLEKMGNVRDRTNVIDQVFGNPNARAKIELALGKKRTKELLQFARIETIMDQLRGAMGNSTTARQLRELGLAGGLGAGAGLWTGDIQTGLIVAAGTRGARAAGAAIDDRVAKRVAKLLVSDDPQDLQKAITLASGNPRFARALEYIQNGVGLMVRGETVQQLRADESP